MKIIYEDKDVLVINKPAGLNVHKKNPNDPQTTLADYLIKKYPFIKNVGVNSLRPGIVHRLDKYTSGVMIIAKTQNIFEWLTRQFKEGKIEKEYTALVVGRPPKNRGTIDSPIGSLGLKKTARNITHSKVTKWRKARTDWRVIKQYKEYTLLLVSPKTGRTHQIRVHLASIGHPIACDRMYGGKRVMCLAGLDRFFLHASRVRFTLPPNRSMEFEADLPDYLSKTLESLL